MDNAWRDLRFAHLAKDPKFRRIPRSERKVKIDKRFISMFKDKKFAVKYTVDKRGRPINQSSSENLRKYYDLSSDDSDSAEGYLEFLAQAKESEEQKPKKLAEGTRDKKETVVGQNQKDEQGEEESDGENFSSNGSLLLVKPSSSAGNSSNEQEIADDSADDTDDDSEREENEQQLKSRRKNEKQLDNQVKKKLRDLTVDYARGEGVLISDSSSDEESSEYDDDDDDEDEIEHNWGELDKEAPTTDEITHRLAACNMDWDRIRATDLMVLFNSFLPTGGLIHSVTIYPSDFGLQRMKEEEVKGPIELVEPKQEVSDEDEEKQHTDDENGEGSSYHMEKLRKYQLNRLKYYYAVIDFDSASTANKVYTECDGLEYESSSTKLDLRFIPNDMTFQNEPKEVCDKLPDLSKYQPRQFTTTALQQVKVDLTWDETNPERQEISQKLNSGKLDEIDKTDIQAYLASGTSEDESEDEVKKQLKGIGNAGEDEDPIDKYKSLLKSIEEAEENKKNKEVQLEFTWGLGAKEKTEKLVKEKMKQTENLTPFEQYLEKRKLKKIAKREQKKKAAEENDKDESDSEDSIPDGIDMNDPYFAEELKNTKPKAKKRKNTPINDKLDSTDEEEEKKRQAELELLLMDEDDESNKKHFSMKRIEEAESLTKSKKKRLSKKKKDLKEEADKDNFQVDVKDSRFEALFTSHHYNIDPADPHYRKTKGTEALVSEKLKRRSENDKDVRKEEKSTAKEKNATSPKVNAELNTLIKSIKRNTQNISKHVK
ncbi:ESF1 homolog [Nasonia vitripennis]|uniref:ESF1 homolog n=1 Tax=Nasonia vitripennis TaxID=7425 RepID=A0A7M7GD51_NASVI|nr:ESF1 homolog [Nasonia vitripennis]XP_003425126.1 ESF1 homolog [Nasonia vitripennis]XP_016842128.1 ESF1 homolog [Nasonia vitripennis]